MNPLEPWRPSPDDPWDDEAAGHLLRRGGFRPSIAELDAALDLGPGETIRRLVAGEPVAPDPERSARAAALDRLALTLATGDDVGRLRQWWLMRLVATDAPLHARLVLQWHDHFATSNVRVRSARLMLGQLRTLQAHALGTFGDLCRAIARDPAMIIWLDGNRNVNGRPNENFARELLELFMLGVGTGYTEADVQEAARAFTGWHQRNGAFRFASLLHDHGEKSVLGRRGPLDGDDVIDAVLDQPACGRFVARRLLECLVSADPPAELETAVADRLRSTGYDLADAVTAILASRACLAPAARRTVIATPAEHVVGLARSLELTPTGDDLAGAVIATGQRLLEPPTVAGWPTHRAWLDPARMLARLDVARRAAAPPQLDPAALARRHGARTPAAAHDLAVRLTLGRSAPPGTAVGTASAGGRTAADALAAVLPRLVACPEYQFI